MTMQFWGPHMRELLAELDARGVDYAARGLAHFHDLMEEITHINLPASTEVEEGAKQYLQALRRQG